MYAGVPSNRRDDRERIVLDGNFDAQAAKTAARFNFEVAIEIWREVGAMGIKRGEHAGDRAIDQVLGRDRLDIVLLHDREDIGKSLEVLIGIVREGLRTLDREVADYQYAHGKGYGHRRDQPVSLFSWHLDSA